MKAMKFIFFFISIIFIWILLESIVRWVAQKNVKTDFYGSIHRDEVAQLKHEFKVKVARGRDWTHFGWIADPEREIYQIERLEDKDHWMPVGTAVYGSWLTGSVSGQFRIMAIDKRSNEIRQRGEVTLTQQEQTEKAVPFEIPRVIGEWHTLFRPEKSGDYVNDHCIFQDRSGNWWLLGITSHSDGDYGKERYFAVGSGSDFPPANAFQEETPVADFGSLAWAPDVIEANGKYHLFWSPNQLHHMTSEDGVNWVGHEIVIEKPFHKFFRDAMIYEVAPGQWLLYATERGKWFSRIDIYQSFDLVHWQYIRPAIRCSWGSEKNFVTGSMESPFLIKHDGHYYLSATYNNESFFLSALLLQLGKFLNKKDYNNTLIFGSTCPYDFGVYHELHRTPNLITRLEAHAPVYIKAKGQWYLTTCGWPFATTLTSGEVAWSKLTWE